MARAPVPLLLVTRSNTRSTVHRPGYSDYVGIKRYNAAGEVIGEHRFIGLFSATAYSARVEEIPLLRHKVAAVTARASLPQGGHLAKALEHILATYPRDDLFQIGEDELYDTALGILAASERQRLRLFLWRDPYERFVSCLVYVPREAYSTELRKKFQAILMAAFAGQRADFGVLLGDTLLARVHFTIRTLPGQVPAYDHREIETRLAAAARRWDDELRDALVDAAGEGQGMALFKRWGAAFPQVYREIVRARAAVPDLLKIDALTPEQPLGLSLYRPLGGSGHSLGFKVYRLGAAGGAVGQPADARAHGRARHGRGQLPHPPGRRRRRGGVAARLQARRTGGRRAGARGAGAAVRGHLRARLPRRGGERRLQPPGAARRPGRRRHRRAARLCQVLQADGLRAVAGHDRGHAGGAAADRTPAGQAVPPAPAPERA